MKKNKFVFSILVFIIVFSSFPISSFASVSVPDVDYVQILKNNGADIPSDVKPNNVNYLVYTSDEDESYVYLLYCYIDGTHSLCKNNGRSYFSVSDKFTSYLYKINLSDYSDYTFYSKLIGTADVLHPYDLTSRTSTSTALPICTITVHYSNYVTYVYGSEQKANPLSKFNNISSSGGSSDTDVDYSSDIADLNNKYYELNQKIESISSDLDSIKDTLSGLQDNLADVISKLHDDNVTINNNISSIFSSIKDNIVPSLGSIDTRLKSVQEKLALTLEKLDSISVILTDINTKFDITLSSFRDSLVSEFTALKAQITNLFTSLQNQLDERFNETYNVIMYGNKEGTYEHPDLQNKLSEYDSNLESINTNISSASSSITSAGDNVASYISGFTELYTGLTNVVGFGAIITFGLAIIFVKKVIGR